jgi:hypothetical protein
LGDEVADDSASREVDETRFDGRAADIDAEEYGI